MIGEFQRFLQSYEIDEVIQLIWLKSNSNEIFSKGTDLKFIYQKVLENKPQEVLDYLASIQQLAVLFGTYNKPILTSMHGELSGSAASLISTLPFSLASPSSRLRWNEPLFGAVPHAGGSYILSRMPHEVGVYLALTGQWVGADDQVNLGLACARLVDQGAARRRLNHDMQAEGMNPATKDYYHHEWKVFGSRFERGKEEFLKQLENEIQQRIFGPNAEDARLAIAEILYKKAVVTNYNTKNFENIERQPLTNPLLHFRENILDPLIQEGDSLEASYAQCASFDFRRISRCFAGNSLTEIRERLRAEPHQQWAQETLALIDRRSPTALALTLQLIRDAETRGWAECLEREYTVMSKLAFHPDFREGVERNIRGSEGGKWQAIPSELGGFFDPVQFEHGIVANALYPVRDFYVTYPDSIRYFLNEQSLKAGLEQRADQEIDVHSFMRNNGLNIGDMSLDTGTVRSMFMAVENKVRNIRVKENKLLGIIGWKENLDQYEKLRREYIEEQFKDLKQIQKLILQQLQRATSALEQERLEAIRHIARIRQFRDKLDFFAQTRKQLLNSQLTQKESMNKDLDKQIGFELGLFFPRDDSKSFLNVVNESLEETTLFKVLYAKISGSEQTIDISKQHTNTWRKLLFERDSQFQWRQPGSQDTHYVRKNELFVKEQLYIPRYGDPEKEFTLRDEYYRRLIENGREWESIGKYLAANTDEAVLEVLRENRQITETELATEAAIYGEPFAKQMRQIQEQEVQRKSNLITETKTIIQSPPTQPVIPSSNDLNHQFALFVESEPQLSELLNPILQDTDAPQACRSLQRDLRGLLQALFRARYRKFAIGARGGAPKFNQTLNGLDELLEQGLRRDVLKLVEPHVLFAFSYLVVSEMEQFYNQLSFAQRNDEQQIIQQLQQLGITLKNVDQLPQVIGYFNKLLEISGILYETYRHNLPFQSDQMLYAYIRLRRFANQGNYRMGDFVLGVRETLIDLERAKQVDINALEGGVYGDYVNQEDALAALEEPQPNTGSLSLQALGNHSFGPHLGEQPWYEKRVYHMLHRALSGRQQERRNLLYGMHRYLQQIDLAAAKAQRTLEGVTPQHIQAKLDKLDELDMQCNWFTQDRLDIWFIDKIYQTILDLLKLRNTNDIDYQLRELIADPTRFKWALVQAFQNDLNLLEEMRVVHEQQKQRLNNQSIQTLKMRYQDQLPSDIPLFVAMSFQQGESDQDYSAFDYHVLAKGKSHPLAKQTVPIAIAATQSRDMQYRNAKIRQETLDSLDPAFAAMGYEQEGMENMHKEVEYLFERVKLRSYVKK